MECQKDWENLKGFLQETELLDVFIYSGFWEDDRILAVISEVRYDEASGANSIYLVDPQNADTQLVLEKDEIEHAVYGKYDRDRQKYKTCVVTLGSGIKMEITNIYSEGAEGC